MPAHILDHFPSDSERLDSFREALLAWYDDYKRELPWRSEPGLYKTVVSEFMLQQTRVATVLPYFERWMNLFPDFTALAKAPEEPVLKAWEGLGYYSRARNLHKLARQLDSWDTIPVDAKSWQALPGIGPYVAAAVTSISFGQAEAVCDGNVVRVLTRLFAKGELFKDGATAQKKLRPLAAELLDTKRPGDYNQAMMELGATICHRQSPLCLTCPVIDYCKSGKTGDFARYPNLAKKKKSKQKITRYWIESEDSLLLCSAAKGSARLGGIYELPENLPPELEEDGVDAKPLATKKRTIGQVEYDEEILKTEILESTKNTLPEGYRWVLWAELDGLTLSGPHRKWIKELRNKTDLETT